MRGVLLVQVLSACLFASWASSAAAEQGSGPRETVDQSFTAKRPAQPTGLSFSATYHAANDPKASPPYMRKMTFYPPRGMRYDTRVPERCSASDAQLTVQGPAACPRGSLLGTGATEGLFMAPITHAFEFDHFKYKLHVFNNTNEQILLVESQPFTVQRGRINPDGSLVFAPTTCFPSPPPGVECADDYILQLGSSTVMPRYTKKSAGGRVRSYAKTPGRCPARGFWRSKIRFWWKDGTKDTVATRQPCVPRRGSRR